MEWRGFSVYLLYKQITESSSSTRLQGSTPASEHHKVNKFSYFLLKIKFLNFKIFPFFYLFTFGLNVVRDGYPLSSLLTFVKFNFQRRLCVGILIIFSLNLTVIVQFYHLFIYKLNIMWEFICSIDTYVWVRLKFMYVICCCYMNALKNNCFIQASYNT